MPALTALAISATMPLARALATRVGCVARGLKRLAANAKNRRDALRLAELDDRMLRDIGLNRCDLRDAYALPPWRDPGRLLARRVAERRGSRRRTEQPCMPVTTVSTELFGTTPAPCYPPTDRPARYLV
jgi:uncharacterized protein YjiS (DUF1127 family)